MRPHEHEDLFVELRPAFAWTCPACGRDVFMNAVVPEMSYEDREEILGETEDTGGCLVAFPDDVTCRHCRKVYRAEPPEFLSNPDKF